MTKNGWLMVFLLWGFFTLFCKPEKNRIEGLKERSKQMYSELGAWGRKEIATIAIVLATILAIAHKNFIPAMANLNKTAIMLCSTISFFILNILNLDDLEQTP